MTTQGGWDTWAKQGFSNFSMFIVIINNFILLFIIANIISNAFIFSSTYIINIMIHILPLRGDFIAASTSPASS